MRKKRMVGRCRGICYAICKEIDTAQGPPRRLLFEGQLRYISVSMHKKMLRRGPRESGAGRVLVLALRIAKIESSTVHYRPRSRSSLLSLGTGTLQ